MADDDTLKTQISAALADGPLTVAEICERTGEPHWSVYSTLQRMLINRDISKRRGRHSQAFVYQLKRSTVKAA